MTIHPYSQTYILREKVWNNLLSFERRKELSKREPYITIPSMIQWSIDDVEIWNEVVFEEVENGVLKSCIWLKNFVQITKYTWQVITIFDNHNHALYFWFDALKRWILQPWFELIHIDEHSDLWENVYELDIDKGLENEEYLWDFTNKKCNVGNYIQPALKNGLVHTMIRIENEFQLDEYMNYAPRRNTLLNIDLDIFSPELGYIPEEKKMKCIKNLMKHVTFVTIATSPYFIEQWIALKKLQDILNEEI